MSAREFIGTVLICSLFGFLVVALAGLESLREAEKQLHDEKGAFCRQFNKVDPFSTSIGMYCGPVWEADTHNQR